MKKWIMVLVLLALSCVICPALDTYSQYPSGKNMTTRYTTSSAYIEGTRYILLAVDAYHGIMILYDKTAKKYIKYSFHTDSASDSAYQYWKRVDSKEKAKIEMDLFR